MTNLCRMRAGIRRPGGMNCFFTDIIRDPYVFEFLGVAENKPMPILPFGVLFYVAEIYEISGRVGRKILTSNPCGLLPEKETVPR